MLRSCVRIVSNYLIVLLKLYILLTPARSWVVLYSLRIVGLDFFDSIQKVVCMIFEKFGRYEIIAEMGQGGMAEVFSARDPKLGRLVALKIIRRNFSEDDKFQERFLNEAKTIAGLEHRAILPVHDFGQDENTSKLYLVMRLMPDVLHKRLARNGAIPLAEASLILNRLAAALEKAHREGIVHRDIKPPNILLDEEGTVFLADFGLAASVDKIEPGFVPQSYGGSPFYMAPEQWLGEAVGPFTDVYQLGVTLFEMLTGKRPFPEEDMELLMDRHVHRPIPVARDFNERLPKDIQPILEKAMSKNPLARHKSCLELAEEVANLLHPRLVKNRYEIREELQHGRLAAVYLAYDLFDKRQVALKVLKHELIPYPSFQKQFQKQRDLLLNLPQNTSVVPIYDMDQDEGRPYIAMQFVEGSSLRERFRKERVLSVETIYELTQCLAQSLDNLHAANLVHGDINMGNVLVDEVGQCYVTDFQITAVAELTKAVMNPESPSDRLGYMPYMAPEQWRGEPVTAQTDVYQFGVMIFELLTGQPPFAGNTPETLQQAIENDPPPKVTSLIPELPAQFDTIFARALAKEPSARFATASEVINRLRQAREAHLFDLFMQQGKAYREEKQWEAAIEAYVRALEMRPESMAAKEAIERTRKRKNDSGILYQSELALKEKRWEDAEYFLTRASETPENKEKLAFVRRMIQAVAKYEAGKAAMQQGQWYLAHNLFDEVDSLSPNYEDVNQLLAEVVEKIASVLEQTRTAISQKQYSEALNLLKPLGAHETAVQLRQEIADQQKKARRATRWDFWAVPKLLRWGGAIVVIAVIVAIAILLPRAGDDAPTTTECLATAVPRLHIQNGQDEYVAFYEGDPVAITGSLQSLNLWVDWTSATDDLSTECQQLIETDENVLVFWESGKQNLIELQDGEKWSVIWRPSSTFDDSDLIVISLLYDNQPEHFEFQLNFSQ